MSNPGIETRQVGRPGDVAQCLRVPTLGFSSGLDLSVVRSSAGSGSVLGSALGVGASAGDALSALLGPLAHALTLSLK